METKVQQSRVKTNIPAGLIGEGIEGFWDEEKKEKRVNYQGKTTKFEDAPIRVQNIIVRIFLNDKPRREYLKKKGVTAFSKGFDWWYRCILGGLDHIPDILNGKLTPDSYNNMCTDYSCQDRGKFCGRGSALKSHESATISALKAGFTIEQTAEMLFISVPGLKSRIETIKEKLGARNMAAMIARGCELGI